MLPKVIHAAPLHFSIEKATEDCERLAVSFSCSKVEFVSQAN